MMFDGGPAFPNQGDDHYEKRATHSYDGMSLRDWFAGQALAGMMWQRWEPKTEMPAIAKAAYRAADAMIAEREKEDSND